MNNNLVRLNTNNLSVGILGYTGETGKYLTRYILESRLFKNVVLIGRRHVQYQEEIYNNAIQKVVDFDRLHEFEEDFRDLDIVFCCLGSKFQDGQDINRKVDLEYCLEAARICKDFGCRHFNLISAAGSSKSSMLYALRIKADVEEEVAMLDFNRCSFYRPHLIVCERENRSVGEAFYQYITKPIQIVAPRLITVPVEVLCKAMVNNSIFIDPDENNREKVEIIGNSRFFDLAELG